ncbi:hypothetical protein [Neolewinella agarilytica]|uniref:hypothetical protein n=1 Tax=Neolewinella agarilytica TaxID=478744 RepID=UPI0023540DC2|nr:hypothetical protein [Neolewinella agarilytica]
MNPLNQYAWAITALTLIAGFLLLHSGWADYGSAFFVLFPCMVGFSIGTHDKRTRGMMSLLFGGLIFFGFLLAGALEGLVCVAMALPIFLIMMLIGYGFRRWLIPDSRQPKKPTDHLLVSLLPLLVLLLTNPIEQALLPEPEIVEIETSVLLPYPADLVFDQVKAMDKLDAEKPWGIWLGLPSPYRCILAADTVGAQRHCLFKNGEIIAEITRYEKGEVLEMDVVDYTLTGREWFQFQDATYTFERVDGQTKITRTSSYKSTLHPRAYWQPLEGWGIQQEHDFVLASLRKNLGEISGQE